jgi:hypothetical protein
VSKNCCTFAAKFDEMRIFDEIKKRFFNAGLVLSWNRATPFFREWGMCKYSFATLIWYNICDLLTDIIEDVKISGTNGTQIAQVAAFRAFVYAWGKSILQKLFDEGFVVIAYDRAFLRFWILDATEYRKKTEDGVTIIEPKDDTLDVYVMKSATFVMYNKSDKDLCHGFLSFLDDVLNGSATVSKRLGAVVVASPKNLTNAPTATVLTEEQKKKLEKEMREDYGALSSQSNIMLLPREMSWQTINLAGLDLKMQEKVKTAILAIVDRIKIPANQVAIIDAQSNKSLANGGEIREGDKLKYKTFRRLFERTFADMARFYGLQIEYVIDGEPIGEDSEVRL